jgi:hypothetical protein
MKTSVAQTAAAVSLAALLMLSGCSLLPSIPNFGDDTGNSSSDENSNGGALSDDEIDENPYLDDVVPDGFPSDVPLPDLEIYLGLGTTEDSWSIIYKSQDLAGDYSDIVAMYEGDGWEVLMNNESDTGSLGVFKKDPYQVQVMGIADTDTDFDGAGISFTVVRSS